jgi:tRNA/tmRNA/rRNA uracil-C5-methylase (TrmA/RlmC/RlmD family)
MKTRNVLFILIITFLSSNAYAQKKLKQDHIDEYGTKVFDVSKEKVFPVIKEVLANNNFKIELEKYEKGLIKTSKKEIGVTGAAQHGVNQSTAQFRKNYRQYYVTFEEVGEGKTKVVFTPKVFIGDADYSEQRVWVLKGQAGEYKLWENLFNEIDERL